MNRDCLRFREQFQPGAQSVHRDGCPSCAAFANAIETAGEIRLDVAPSADLLTRLRAIPEQEEARRWSAGPFPQIPLPEALRERLRRIPAHEGRPPSWIRRPGYAVAASYLLTVLLGAAVGNPATFSREAAATLKTGLVDGLEEQALSTLTSANTRARERLDQWSESAIATYRVSRARITSSLDTTHQKIKELAGTILSPDEPEERDADSDPAPSKGDKQ